jgi:hypothetical protein
MGTTAKMQRVQLAIIVASAFIVTFASLATTAAQQAKQLRAGLPALTTPHTAFAAID